MSFPVPHNEQARLEALRSFNILDTEAEQALDDLTLLASHICDTPIALISLIDGERQWFKSKIGLEGDETSRDVSFCTHAILHERVFTVPDATCDERFAANPLVRSNPKIRFYAGMPLFTADGHGLGTLCVIDNKAKQLTDSQNRSLEALGRQVMSQLELRRALAQKIAAEKALTEKAAQLNEAQRIAKIGSFEFDPVTQKTVASGELLAINGLTAEENGVSPSIVFSGIHPDDAERVREKIACGMKRGDPYDIEFRIANEGGTTKHVHLISTAVKDTHGNLLRWRGTLQDITERKRAEEQIRQSEKRFHAEQLRTIEQQRVVELQKTQIQTLREVTLTLKDKINNPLTIILMTFEMWRRDHRLPEEVLKRMETAKTAALRISHTLNEVSALHKYRTLDTSFGKVLDIYSQKDETIEV